MEDVYQVIEATLEQISPIDMMYAVPQPAWHGHDQRIYRLSRAPKFMLVDLAVIKHSSANRFLEPEIHGPAQVLFDKDGSTRVPRLEPLFFVSDVQDLRQKMDEAVRWFEELMVLLDQEE